MDRKKIFKELEEKHNSTLLSFPDRGPWGDRKYRGNCSGWIHAFLIWKYHVSKMAELFSGSGTGYDVCKDIGISYVGADLNPVPVRPGILCINALIDDVPEEFLDADMVFMHPPYGKEINIPYAGSMYPDADKKLSAWDLGQMPWKKFMSELNRCIMKYYAAMKTGSRIAILMGDVRRNGLHSMLADIVKPGELEQIIIKEQHNCSSDGKKYTNYSFVPIEHEYLMVLRKAVEMYMINFQLPQKCGLDIRDSESATWRDVVFAVMQQKKSADLQTIYSEIDGHKKCKNNKNWKAKVRQTLQMCSLFTSTERGVWHLAA